MGKMISLYHIKKVGLSEWRRREWWAGREVLIWSNEHGGWRRPDAAGYTGSRDEAWRVDFATAYDHTKHCGPEKMISFCDAGPLSQTPA